ncbi:uncharacterized protein PG986_004837 [Apiospora aurea]|uniref:Chitin-binding type-4 domain-containing protein n=1 Tax=Apiospora aurea TaxID=335848 RepID=A0ABR1QG47_9PEZI
MRAALATALGLLSAAGVADHAVVETPTPRRTGPVQRDRCGAALTAQLEKDVASPIEDAMKKADEAYKCNAYLCRGYQLEDNLEGVQTVKAGDVLDFQIDLIAGHHPGYANVSVVDLATNQVIGEPLRSWADWPDSTSGPPRNDIDFNITLPDSLRSACDVAGKCAIQWYWWASKNRQTYESCVDFYLEQ